MAVDGGPPNEVTLVYKHVAGTHSFFSMEIPGLAVGSDVLKEAFDLAIEGLGVHVGRLWGVDVKYDALVSYNDFAESLRAASGLSKIGVPLRGRLHLDQPAQACV